LLLTLARFGLICGNIWNDRWTWAFPCFTAFVTITLVLFARPFSLRINFNCGAYAVRNGVAISCIGSVLELYRRIGVPYREVGRGVCIIAKSLFVSMFLMKLK
jgi:hypothetical protein